MFLLLGHFWHHDDCSLLLYELCQDQEYLPTEQHGCHTEDDDDVAVRVLQLHLQLGEGGGHGNHQRQEDSEHNCQEGDGEADPGKKKFWMFIGQADVEKHQDAEVEERKEHAGHHDDVPGDIYGFIKL